MAQKDIGNKVPLHTLKKTEDVMKFYDDWGKENKYDKDMSDWNYTGPKETSEVFNKYANDKEIKIYDAGCGTGLVGVELKKYGFNEKLIKRVWNMLKNAEFKRYQSAIGPKISSMSFDKDRRFPITNKFKI